MEVYDSAPAVVVVLVKSTMWSRVAGSTAKSIFLCTTRPGAQSLTLCTKT
jgi:hypothetical protein